MTLSYKDTLKEAMTELGTHDDFVAVGYNLCDAGGAGGGTFSGVPKEKRQEMPLAENLMAGASIGLSLQGYVPLLWFERMDFMACAFDSIVCHLDKLAKISDGVHRPACIIRAVVGNSKSPLYTGPTHTQNFTKALREMVSFPVIELHAKHMIEGAYRMAYKQARAGTSTCLVEFKDNYQF